MVGGGEGQPRRTHHFALPAVEAGAPALERVADLPGARALGMIGEVVVVVSGMRPIGWHFFFCFCY